jgi:hypothetical protein
MSGFLGNKEALMMRSASYDLSISAVRADALFASALQCSDKPSPVQIRHAIAAATRAFGDLGCAARVAQEYGEHPDTAVVRMRWARTAVAGAFDSPSDTGYVPRHARPAGACPAPRSPRDLAGRPPAHALLQAC